MVVSREEVNVAVNVAVEGRVKVSVELVDVIVEWRVKVSVELVDLAVEGGVKVSEVAFIETFCVPDLPLPNDISISSVYRIKTCSARFLCKLATPRILCFHWPANRMCYFKI